MCSGSEAENGAERAQKSIEREQDLKKIRLSGSGAGSEAEREREVV